MKTPARFDVVQPAMAFAAAHLDDDLRLEALSAQTGVSAFHMHRLFVAVAGETPKAYTLRLRLDSAAALLLASRDSIVKVALSCGFASPEAFSRAFRRAFHLSPRDTVRAGSQPVSPHRRPLLTSRPSGESARVSGCFMFIQTNHI